MTRPDRRRRVSAKDVAAEAGVSVMSVSNAFNRPGKLSPERRTEILEIAERLGYLGPDPKGRSLRLGRSGAIGVVLAGSLSYAIDDPAAILLLRGIAEVGEFAEVALTLVPFPSTGPSHVQSVAVDGFIIYSLPEGDPAVETAVARGLPFVIVDGPPVSGHSMIGIDDRAGARAAAQHLVDLGHRRFAILVDRLTIDGHVGIATPERARHATYHWGRDRVQGYLEVLAAAGIQESNVAIQEAGGYTIGESRSAASALLNRTDVTAILASTDVLALATMEEVRARGLQIGRDISIVGFDDIPAASMAGLTTVAQPLVDRGRIAAQMLLAAMRGAPPVRRVLDISLVVRQSTGSVPSPEAPRLSS
jgi:DNA-binding LacI/PurR family transcriptional regulator